MSDTPNLALPYVAANQSQKHVTVNESLRRLDALVQLAVQSRALLQPPASPVEGVRYLVPAAATGSWAGQAGKLAAFQDSLWTFYTPLAGWLCWVIDEQALLAFENGSWANAGGAVQSLPLLGVNATADTANRLAVASAATLLTHDGAGHQVKVNKATPAATASLLFQSSYSGRAEMGLAGDDDFHVKVSGDGITWREGMVMDRTSGAVSFPASLYAEGAVFNLMGDGGRFAGSPEPTNYAASTFSLPSWLASSNDAAITQHGKFTRNSSSYGGAGAGLDADTKQLVDTVVGTNFRRNYPEFFVAKVTAGSATSSGMAFLDGVTRYTAIYSNALLRPVTMSFSYYLKVKSGDVGIPKYSTMTAYLDGVSQSGHFVVPADGNWHHVLIIEGGSFDQHYRYSYDSLRFFMRNADVALLAFPAALPGRIKLPVNVGQVPGIRAW